MIMGLISLEKLKIRESPINGLVVLMIRRTTTIVFWLTHWTLWVGGLQETTLLLISKTLIHTHTHIKQSASHLLSSSDLLLPNLSSNRSIIDQIIYHQSKPINNSSRLPSPLFFVLYDNFFERNQESL